MLPGVLHVLIHAQALLLQTLCEILNHAASLALDHQIRDIHGSALNSLLYQSILLRGLRSLLLLLGQLRADVSLVLLQSLKIGYFACELVVQLRKLLCLDRVNLALEDCGFACQFLRMVLFGEVYIYFLLFAQSGADQLLLETGDKRTGTDGQREVLCLAALESNAVNETFKIQLDHVAVSNRDDPQQ